MPIKVIVDKTSALMYLSGNRERQVGLSRDHEDICKFSDPDSDDYELVSDHVCRLAQEAIASSQNKHSPLSVTALSTPNLGSHPIPYELEQFHRHEEHSRSISMLNPLVT
jgi:hypothetical protein